MPPAPITDAEREELIALARGGDDLILYARIAVERSEGAVAVTFEPEWVFVTPHQLVVDKLVATIAESADAESGAVRRRLVGRATELSQGRAVEKARLGQEAELLKDSPERRKALEVVELALKKHGNFGSHGDLSGGLAPLCAANKVVVYDEPDVYSVTANPRGPRGGEPRFEFRVKKRDGAIDEVLIAVVPAIDEVPVPPTRPGFKGPLEED